MAIDKVKKYFSNYNMEDKIIEFSQSSATVELAAKALNCKEEEIAKTMAFIVNGKPILIVCAGDTKIDNAKFREYFNTKAVMINKDELINLIGHEMGGVCPFAINEDVDVYLDSSIKRFEYVYPACGSINSAIKLNIEELEKYSNYICFIDVTKFIEKEKI